MAFSETVCVIQKDGRRTNSDLDKMNARSALDATNAKKRKLEWEEQREVDFRVGLG